MSNLIIATIPLEEIRRAVEESIRAQVRMLEVPGKGIRENEWPYLERINRIISKGQELGLTDLRVIEESKFDTLLTAICDLQVIGAREQIRQIMTNLLTSCGIPATVFAK